MSYDNYQANYPVSGQVSKPRSTLFAKNHKTTEDVVNYSYAPKSKIQYSRKMVSRDKRSKTGAKFTAAAKLAKNQVPTSHLPDVKS